MDSFECTYTTTRKGFSKPTHDLYVYNFEHALKWHAHPEINSLGLANWNNIPKQFNPLWFKDAVSIDELFSNAEKLKQSMKDYLQSLVKAARERSYSKTENFPL